MLFFAHAGITLGAAASLANLARMKSRGNRRQAPTSPSPTTSSRLGHWLLSFFDPLASFADLRVLLVGSLLPDIIDKPLGIFILGDSISNGRIYSHTLIFLIALCAIGSWRYLKSRKTWGLALAFGVAMHLILDGMWTSPGTLLWPLLGQSFSKDDLGDWIPAMVHGLATRPWVNIPEAVGLAVVAWLAYVVIRRKNVWAFVIRGRVI